MSVPVRYAVPLLGLGALAVSMSAHHDPRAEHLQHLPTSVVLGTAGMTASGSTNVVQVHASTITHAEIEAPGPGYLAAVVRFSALTWS